MANFLITTAARVATAYIAGTVQRQISNLFAGTTDGPRTAELEIQTSTEGAPVPLVYGRMRLAGQLIWAARFNETSVTRSAGGGKGGGPKVTDYSYSVSFAVGLCEGEIGGIGRIWADGKELTLQDIVWRYHPGSAEQGPDPLMEAVEGAGNVPAYRGLAYVVFEDLPLEDFGNRIPNLSFEVIAPVDQNADAMEARIEGVCLIPSSGEFAYADRAVMRALGEGEDKPENHHTTRASCDLDAALDDLQARLPRCGSVALVTAWFGDDLRAQHCTLTPRAETDNKDTHPLSWAVAGLDRHTARLVSQDKGQPVFGGTPSDETVIQAIRALSARGQEVTLYPFILMDIPAGNGLPDPYGGVEQAAFAWRGRITCDPAPGELGSVDKTAAASAQVDAFFGSASAADFTVSGDQISYTGPDEWGFNRFILHHAAIAKAAGGVESFIIGSEMRALTQIRDSAVHYPAVAKLVALAAEVRALLGPDVKLSYAADWSEYFGHAPGDGSGDRFFHLDPLWASADIDFVGIDWYAPLSDWREGDAHLDALAGAASIHDRDYLGANVEGGEGFDWFYASQADRDAQLRTAISDGAYGEPWVWRYKDLRNWWSQPHHNRPGGVRESTATGWVPQSKPVRLVELGCPAVDKGANQPNVFLDPKSAESTAPYYSTGVRDDLIQRRYIEALLGHWQGEANPVSSVYGANMLDLTHSHVWTWDARPFPEFPSREDVWSDGPNWRRGHWLTGRAGQSLVGEIIADLASRAGLDTLDTTGVDGVLAGFTVVGGARARDEIARLGAVFGFDLVDRAGGVVCVPHARRGAPTPVQAQSLAHSDQSQGQGLTLSREPQDTQPVEVRVQFHVDDGAYNPASVSALGLDPLTDDAIDIGLRALSDRDIAVGWAQDVLARARADGEAMRFQLPPSLSRLETGDRVAVDTGPQGKVWRLTATDGMAERACELTSTADASPAVSGPQPTGNSANRPLSRPLLVALDLPLGAGQTQRNGLWVTAWSTPWPGSLSLFAGSSVSDATERASLSAPSWIGVLTAPLAPGFEGRWDRASTLEMRLNGGAVSSLGQLAVLNGQNRLAVETPQGIEVLAFTTAVLGEDGLWRISGLLRGLGGSPVEGAVVGARVVVLDGSGAVLPLEAYERGLDLTLLAVPPGKAINDISVRQIEARYDGVDLRPLSPVHVRASQAGGDLTISWVRRARIASDAWSYGDVPLDEAREAYQVELFDNGSLVRSVEVTSPLYTLPAADQLSLFASGLAHASVQVAQISDQFGAGRSASLSLAP
jgi:hypothetical protein